MTNPVTGSGAPRPDLRVLARRPWLLAPNFVRRFYRGGGMVRAFRGDSDTTDSWASEDWLASCVLAAGGGDGMAGLSAIPANGTSVFLRDLISAHPEEILGRPATRLDRPEVLVKLVASATRVPLHTHPSRAFARMRLGSPFGKTEAWIILAVAESGDEPPYVGVGLQPGVGRAELAELVRRQDHVAFAETLIRRRIQAGEVYLIPGGTPHFFGPKILVLNVQEPADFTVLAEWEGASTEPNARLGMDWDTALRAFEIEPGRTPTSPDDALQRPSTLREMSGGREIRLFGSAANDYFDVTRLEVDGDLAVDDGRFGIGVVIEGSGAIEYRGSSERIAHGDCYACPATVPYTLRAVTAPLVVIRCMEPRMRVAGGGRLDYQRKPTTHGPRVERIWRA